MDYMESADIKRLKITLKVCKKNRGEISVCIWQRIPLADIFDLFISLPEKLVS